MSPNALRKLVKQGRMSEAPAKTQVQVREDVMAEWARRWTWLK